MYLAVVLWVAASAATRFLCRWAWVKAGAVIEAVIPKMEIVARFPNR
jgi:hypothetical protein